MESKPPLVSVIIPFFNATDWLEETIRSVLAQDFRDFEIALVDDGSTDESTTIARYFSDRYSNILYVEHERHANQGVACSRNLGIGKTRGEYIATLDADDYWEPNKLAEQIAMMEAHHNNLNEIVGTTKRSIEAIPSAWLRRNVLQPCEGGRLRRAMYLATEVWPTSMPSLRSSP